jgi:hypothetical protein
MPSPSAVFLPDLDDAGDELGEVEVELGALGDSATIGAALIGEALWCALKPSTAAVPRAVAAITIGARLMAAP